MSTSWTSLRQKLFGLSEAVGRRPRAGIKSQARFNTILKETAEAVSSPVFIPRIEDIDEADFINRGRFSPQGSTKLAAMLAPLVRANCRGAGPLEH